MSAGAQSQNGTARWSMIGGIVIAVVAVIGGVVQVGSLANTVTSQEQRIHDLEEKATKSIDDRSGLRADFASYKSATDAKLAEIETQFSAMNAFVNVEIAQRRQFDGVFFQKLYGQDLPSNAFYPALRPGEQAPQAQR